MSSGARGNKKNGTRRPRRAPRTPEGFTWPGLDQATTRPVSGAQAGSDAAGATDTQAHQTAAFADMTFSSPPVPTVAAPAGDPILDAPVTVTRRRRPTTAVLAIGGALVLVAAGGVGVASSMGAFDRGKDADLTVTSVSTPTPVQVTTPPDTAEQSGQTTQPQSLARTPSTEATEAAQITQDGLIQQIEGSVPGATQLFWSPGTSQATTGIQTSGGSTSVGTTNTGGATAGNKQQDNSTGGTSSTSAPPSEPSQTGPTEGTDGSGDESTDDQTASTDPTSDQTGSTGTTDDQTGSTDPTNDQTGATDDTTTPDSGSSPETTEAVTGE